MQSAELPAASAARRCSLGLLILVMFAVGTSTFGAESDEEVWDVTSEPLEVFEVTATFDYHSDWNELPVPRGTTYEDYYGSGRSILHGPGKTWHIEKPYVFKFVRQEGAKLFFHFEHREAIAHAFIGHGLYGNRFEPRNPGISAFHRFKWRPISGGGCYTALRTFILEPNHPATSCCGSPSRAHGRAIPSASKSTWIQGAGSSFSQNRSEYGSPTKIRRPPIQLNRKIWGKTRGVRKPHCRGAPMQLRLKGVPFS